MGYVVAADTHTFSIHFRRKWPWIVFRRFVQAGARLADATASSGFGVMFTWSRTAVYTEQELRDDFAKAEMSGEEWAKQYQEWEADLAASRKRRITTERLN